MIQYEPADAFNPELVGLFASIGIKKGKPFAPDARMKKILKDAAAIGNATARAIVFRPRNEAFYYYPDRQWYTSFTGGHDFMNNGELVLDDRIMFHYVATGITPAMATPKVGTGSAYASTPKDAKGKYLDGGKTYKVTLPAPIPVNNFWSFMVYSGQHRSMLETDQKSAGLDSNIRPLNQTRMDLIRFGSGQKRQKGTRAIGFKRSPEKATCPYYDSMAHWSRGSTKPGNLVILSLWSSHLPLRRLIAGLQMPANNHMHSDSRKRRSYLAHLSAAGDVRRSLLFFKS